MSETGPSWEKSAPGWLELMAQGDVNRTHLLDEPMLRLSGDVAGQDVIDIGCGEGRFCRMLAARGGRVVGIDPTRELLAAARAADPEGKYIRASAQSLPVDAAQFDLAVFYLTLIDIADFRTAISEAVRVLRPGGRMIVANTQSFASTRPSAWYRNERGEKLHMAVEEYFAERGMRSKWGKIDITNYHRPLASYLTAFITNGLTLTAFEEPQPTEEAVRLHPRMRDERIVPLFYVAAWRKGRGVDE